MINVYSCEANIMFIAVKLTTQQRTFLSLLRIPSESFILNPLQSLSDFSNNWSASYQYSCGFSRDSYICTLSYLSYFTYHNAFRFISVSVGISLLLNSYPFFFMHHNMLSSSIEWAFELFPVSGNYEYNWYEL